MRKLLIVAAMLSALSAAPANAGSLHGAAYRGAKAAGKGSYAAVKAAARGLVAAVKHL